MELQLNKMPTVTIKTEVSGRIQQTKNGAQQVFEQNVQIESDQVRFSYDMRVDGQNSGFPVGRKYFWNVLADIVPGRYGPELARKMSLIEATEATRSAKVG